uniref:Proliferation-associated SNF2-like protein n=1 Tax=Timema cristinae TaxID=61476 RepID=A0A7R9CH19_TIMCR|nr:unnamed protein product [Timema cristinae]
MEWQDIDDNLEDFDGIADIVMDFEVNENNFRVPKKYVRYMENPVEIYSEAELHRCFWFGNVLFPIVNEALLKPTNKGLPWLPVQKLSLVLSYYATGNIQSIQLDDSHKESLDRIIAVVKQSKVFTNFLKLKLERVKQEEQKKINKQSNKVTRKVSSSDISSRKLRENMVPNVISQTQTKDNKRLKETEDISQKSTKRRKVGQANFNLASMIDIKTLEKYDAERESDLSKPSETTGMDSLLNLTLLEGHLRDYQVVGFSWLRMLHENGMNGILADEMGLGKTIQVIAQFCHLFESGVKGPFIVIGPMSTLSNWVNEFKKFAPQIPTVLYHGCKEERITLRRKIKPIYTVCGRKQYPVLITSFQIPMLDNQYLSTFVWKYLVVDEGHRLKNHKCQLARTLSTYKTETRVILTGTPIQNDLSELWSLLNFLLPDVFNNLALFQTFLDVEKLEEATSNDNGVAKESINHIVSNLHQILSPFMLRRVKADFDLGLPPKKEVVVYCSMSELQRKRYQATLESNLEELVGISQDPVIPDSVDGKRAKRSTRKIVNYSVFESTSVEIDEISPAVKDYSISSNTRKNTYEEEMNVKIINKMQNPMMQLRKIVNHPYLVYMPLVPGTKTLQVDEGLVTNSGKFQVLDAMLPKLKAKGHKILLFSTFFMVLDLVEEYLIMRGYKFCRLDGSTKLETRQENIDAFNQDPDLFIFLISTRAGGLGINLVAADTVIIFDSDWNPQVDLQAQDRCHRIGQAKPVVIYRLVTKGTVDEKILQRATEKRRLEKIVIKNGKFKLNADDEIFDPRELLDLLVSTDYQQAIHPNGFVLSDEELDSLLDRSNVEDSFCNSVRKAVQPS